VQQVLKDHGFYYGQVNGEKNADTTAAIRRYQIRKGLKITGELDTETLKSLSGSSNTVSSGPLHAPATTAVPAVTPNVSASPPSTSPTPRSFDSQTALISPRYPYGPAVPSAEAGQIFAGTPYEHAPIDLQMRAVAQAQALLRRAGYYGGRIDGVYGPGTAGAVRSFQSRAGILPTGQLDSGSLAALGLPPAQELQGSDEAQWNHEARPGDDALEGEKGKWKIKKHHHRFRVFIIRPF
jgi:peptidoglycan hydrolase-like protein with peptidoglycan-binding domain